MRLRRASRTSFAVLAILALVQPARPQGWPERPVRIVVPFAAGGNGDIIARIIAQHLGEGFAQQFIVEDHPGASGTIAAELVARSAPDGHTLLMGNVPAIAVAPALGRLAYDPSKDFAPISNIGTNPFVLVVHPSIPANTAREFVAYVRKQPNKVTYAASGVGSLTHLLMALFAKRADLELIPVMYKGGAAPLTDVLAGHVKAYFANLSTAVPHARSDALRLLAVTSEDRAPQIPDVPTFGEAGFAQFTALTWNGLLAPAATPKAIVDRLAAEVARGVHTPQLARRLIDNGYEPLGNTPDEFAATIAADIALWAEAVKIAGVQDR